jgi:hypothetical protein
MSKYEGLILESAQEDKCYLHEASWEIRSAECSEDKVLSEAKNAIKNLLRENLIYLYRYDTDGKELIVKLEEINAIPDNQWQDAISEEWPDKYYGGNQVFFYCTKN